MNDFGITIAIVGVGIAIVGVVISMMFWVRNEGNDLREEQKEDRRDSMNLIRAIELENTRFSSKTIGN